MNHLLTGCIACFDNNKAKKLTASMQTRDKAVTKSLFKGVRIPTIEIRCFRSQLRILEDQQQEFRTTTLARTFRLYLLNVCSSANSNFAFAPAPAKDGIP